MIQAILTLLSTRFNRAAAFASNHIPTLHIRSNFYFFNDRSTRYSLLTLACEPRELALSMSSTSPLMDAPPMSLLKNTCSRIVGSTAPRDVILINSWPKRLGACGLCTRIYSSKALRVLFWTACTWTASESWSISVKIANDRLSL